MKNYVKEMQDYIKDLSMFGIRMHNGVARPILQRVETNPCKNCNGFGTYGNPLCGAAYLCDKCDGSGSAPIITQVSFIQKIKNWFRN